MSLFFSARFAQPSKHIKQRQPNANSSDRLVHPLPSSKAPVVDNLEFGRPIHQTSAKNKPTSMCVAQVSETQIGASYYDDESDSASDSDGN